MARVSKEQRVERQQRAFELRKAGKSFRQIGEMLDYSHEMVRKDIQSIIDELVSETRRDAEELIAVELARLNDLMFAMWPDARRGELKSVMAVLKIIERRTKLLGLEVNRQISVTLTREELARMSDDELNDIINTITYNSSS